MTPTERSVSYSVQLIHPWLARQVLDYLHLGSTLSLRSYARLGSALSVLDCVYLGSALSLRSFQLGTTIQRV